MEEQIRSVVKYFDRTSVPTVKLDFGHLMLDNTIRVKQHETDFTQKIEVMEFDHHPVEKAWHGQFTGIRVSQSAKPFGLVYKITR